MLFRLIFILLFFPLNVQAINCRSSRTLSHLVANSDAISLISIKDVGLLIKQNGIDPLVAINTKENYKIPLFRGLAKNKKARIFSKYLDWSMLRRYSEFVVFMDYQDNAWVPKECGLLPITSGNKVRGACELISDLYNESPFKREKLCTLIHPNYVPLETLKNEIAKRVLNDYKYEGNARVFKIEPYQGQNRYYRLYVEFSLKDRASFFSVKKLSDSTPVKLLYKVDNKEDEKIYLKLFKGDSIKITGFWTMGNFVLNTIE